MMPLLSERSMVESVSVSAWRAPSAFLLARSPRSLRIWERRRLRRARLMALRRRLLRRFLMADLMRATWVPSCRRSPVLEAHLPQPLARDAGLLGLRVGGDDVLQLDDRFGGPVHLEERESFLQTGRRGLVAGRVGLQELIVGGDRLGVTLLGVLHLAGQILHVVREIALRVPPHELLQLLQRQRIVPLREVAVSLPVQILSGRRAAHRRPGGRRWAAGRRGTTR